MASRMEAIHNSDEVSNYGLRAAIVTLSSPAIASPIFVGLGSDGVRAAIVTWCIYGVRYDAHHRQSRISTASEAPSSPRQIARATPGLLVVSRIYGVRAAIVTPSSSKVAPSPSSSRHLYGVRAAIVTRKHLVSGATRRSSRIYGVRAAIVTLEPLEPFPSLGSTASEQPSSRSARRDGGTGDAQSRIYGVRAAIVTRIVQTPRRTSSLGSTASEQPSSHPCRGRASPAPAGLGSTASEQPSSHGRADDQQEIDRVSDLRRPSSHRHIRMAERRTVRCKVSDLRRPSSHRHPWTERNSRSLMRSRIYGVRAAIVTSRSAGRRSFCFVSDLRRPSSHRHRAASRIYGVRAACLGSTASEQPSSRGGHRAATWLDSRLGSTASEQPSSLRNMDHRRVDHALVSDLRRPSSHRHEASAVECATVSGLGSTASEQPSSPATRPDRREVPCLGSTASEQPSSLHAAIQLSLRAHKSTKTSRIYGVRAAIVTQAPLQMCFRARARAPLDPAFPCDPR